MFTCKCFANIKYGFFLPSMKIEYNILLYIGYSINTVFVYIIVSFIDKETKRHTHMISFFYTHEVNLGKQFVKTL